MKRKVLSFAAVAILLTILVVVFVVPLLTEKPEDPHEVKECFVSWSDFGMLKIDVFYADGTYSGKTLDVDTARQTFADDETVLAHIERMAATERNVVWWKDDDHVLVGVGDSNEYLTVDEALEKYHNNSIIVEKIQNLSESSKPK